MDETIERRRPAAGGREKRRRAATAMPLLRSGFRPFFLLGALYAVVAVLLWLGLLAGLLDAPGGQDPLFWHRHEMLFGFASAIIAGFVLTAVPNWTGRLPVAGPLLAALALLWLAVRLDAPRAGGGGR